MFQLRLITPSGELLSTQTEEIRAPGAFGGFGVRAGHTPFITTLDAGPLAYKTADGWDAYAVIDGFVEVDGDEVIVLAEEAEHARDISVEAELEAIKAAEARMVGRSPESDEYRMEAATIRRATARAFTAKR